MKKATEDLRKRLIENAVLIPLVAARVYQNAAPQDVTYPFIVYTKSSQERPKTHDQRTNTTKRKADRYLFDITAYSTNADNANTIAEAIDNALDGQNGADAAGAYVFLFQDASSGGVFRADNSGIVDHTSTVQVSARQRPHD